MISTTTTRQGSYAAGAPIPAAAGRGWRRPLAAVLLIAAIAAAFITPGWGGGPSGSVGKFQFDASGPEWADQAIKLGTLLFGVAAALVWAVRRRVALWVAALLALAALPLVIAGTNARTHLNSIPPAQFRGLERGTSKSEITGRFGYPVDEGSYTVGGGPVDCVFYESEPRHGFYSFYVLCFRDDRLVARF